MGIHRLGNQVEKGLVNFRGNGSRIKHLFAKKKIVAFLSTSQYLWKNMGWRPSGPGAFVGLKDLIARIISMSWRGSSGNRAKAEPPE